ncbi:MAG: class I SAM-dependent methyltransferase [Candidatus Methanofastidiosia archaeon]
MSWDELFLREKFRWKNPSPVVFYFEENFDLGKKILDLGCGAGRHTIFLARKGYQVLATDISENGVRYTKKWLKREGLEAELGISDMEDLPFGNERFDAVICIFVVHHNTLYGIEKTLKEIHRVLKKNGLSLITLKSSRDARFGQGEKIDEDTFLFTSGDEKGIPHYFCSRKTLDKLFSNFEILELWHWEVERPNIPKRVNWVVVGKKPP